MINVYLIAGIVGIVVVLLSLFGGDHEHDIDAGLDGGHHEAGDFHGLGWLPFLSLRFWMFGAAAFGLTGFFLTLAKVAEPRTGIISGITGFVTGMLIHLMTRMARRGESSVLTVSADLIGKRAQVLVRVRPDEPGRVRMEVNGETIDMLALADTNHPFEIGEEVFVTSIEGNQARVSSLEEVMENQR